jgi:hypothetical protein
MLVVANASLLVFALRRLLYYKFKVLLAYIEHKRCDFQFLQTNPTEIKFNLVSHPSAGDTTSQKTD